MPNEAVSQAVSLIQKAKTVLVIFKNDFLGDSLAAALALAKNLQTEGKKTKVLSGEGVDEKYNFLPFFSEAAADLASEEGILTIKIQDGKNKLGEFWYEQIGNDVEVYLSPKAGQAFKKNEVSVGFRGEKWDLLITVGVPALNSLGSIFTTHTDIFFNTPIVNLDISAANEGFGAVNVVDLVATSNAEIVYSLLEVLYGQKMAPDIATLLLAGLIAKTDSFQSVRTTPRSLFVAARLCEAGARQQDIIKNLYKTKTLGLLKLWGRALARLSVASDYNLVSASVSAGDILEAGADSRDIASVAQELFITLSDARTVLFLAEVQSGQIHGYLYVKPPLNFDDLLLDLKAKKNSSGLAKFALSGLALETAQQAVMDQIINWLKAEQRL